MYSLALFWVSYVSVSTFCRRSSVSSSPGSDAEELNGPRSGGGGIRDDGTVPLLSDPRPTDAVGLSRFSLMISTVWSTGQM